MKLTFLGTGTSFGIPVVGCGCAACASDDPRDRRTRHAAVLTGDDGRRLLVDTPPELRLQLVRAGVDALDAVWYTHCHADHTHGIDDLRAFTIRSGDPLPVYASEACAATLLRRFEYIFDERAEPQPGTSAPKLRLHTIRPGKPVEAGGFELLPVAVPHGIVQVLGFRIGALGYVTDAKRLPPEAVDALRGVRVLVLNALWEGRRHPTHFTVEEAVEAARTLDAGRTYLTHLTHRVVHAELEATLPEGVAPAYDGLTVEIPA